MFFEKQLNKKVFILFYFRTYLRKKGNFRQIIFVLNFKVTVKRSTFCLQSFFSSIWGQILSNVSKLNFSRINKPNSHCLFSVMDMFFWFSLIWLRLTQPWFHYMQVTARILWYASLLMPLEILFFGAVNIVSRIVDDQIDMKIWWTRPTFTKSFL